MYYLYYTKSITMAAKENRNNPYLVFLVMDREKKSHGEAQIYIDSCLQKMKIQDLNKKYGL